MTKLDQKQRQRIIVRHRASIERNGYQPAALFWSSQEIQEIRFQQLARLLERFDGTHRKEQYDVLDVGCGFGDLARYLAAKGLPMNYHGIDLSPDMVFAGKSQYPDLDLREGELFDFNYEDEAFDFVLLSGALNEVVDETGNYAKSVIQEMYRICRKGVAFNLLNARDAWTHNRPDLQSFDSEQVRQYCEGFCRSVEVVDDYLENDFTVYLQKEADDESGH
ncbi:MAG: class I SAM-dependent methyltransferase [Hydrogenovibrio sp.]|nr:class I SAM-dependent methyltransferase [Hydrogenovibrio sp.]